MRQLSVRTCVARNVRLADYTDMTAQSAASNGPSRLTHATASSFSKFTDCSRRNTIIAPSMRIALPYGDFAIQYGRFITKRLLHSYGAIQSLERLLEMTHPDGFILINDYGQTQTTRDDEFEHQRFSLATFVGVNFPMLKSFFADGNRCQVVEPTGDSRGIHSRLLSKRPSSETVTRFFERFSDQAKEKLHEPIQRSRACLRRAASSWRRATTTKPSTLSRATGCCSTKSACS